MEDVDTLVAGEGLRAFVRGYMDCRQLSRQVIAVHCTRVTPDSG